VAEAGTITGAPAFALALPATTGADAAEAAPRHAISPLEFVEVCNRAAATLVAAGYFYLLTDHLKWMIKFVVSALDAGLLPSGQINPVSVLPWVRLRLEVTAKGVDGKRVLTVSLHLLPFVVDHDRLGLRRRHVIEDGEPDNSFRLIALFLGVLSLAGVARRMGLEVLRMLTIGLLGLVRATVMAIPPLLVAVVVVFVTGDAWRLLGSSYDWRYWALIGLFMLLSIAFVVRSTGSAGDARAAVKQIAKLKKKDFRLRPRHSATRLLHIGCKPDPKPTARDYRCIGRGLKVGGVGQVVAVGAWMAFALVLVGVILLDSSATKGLMGTAPVILQSLPHKVVITRELVLVSTSLGAFASLYFAALGLSDAKTRAAFMAANARSMKRTVLTLRLYHFARDNVEELTGISPRHSDGGGGGQIASAEVAE
jgi:hypothetical protein